VLIGSDELAWSLKEPWGTTPVPELYVRELDRSPQLMRIGAGQQVLPGLTAHHAPGHTPGHLIFVLEGESRDIIFTGDAAKNRAEILSRSADMTYDQTVSRTSIEMIWGLWQHKPGTVVIPGHDVPMVLQDGEPVYIADRQGGIAAWFDTTLDQTKIFDIT
jgi:N-acyl homoserine lactone hydrolase